MQNPPSKLFQFEPGRVFEILSELGYSLSDCGAYYRTKALYRGGDSPLSLQIWKDTGYCVDYAADKKFPLKELLLSHGIDWRKIKELLAGQNVAAPVQQKKKFYMPQTYPPECLERLLPNYFFYRRKKISDETQKKYRVGFATEGKMYQRMVFPIFDEHQQIIGFSGRHIDWKEESKAPKWKHIGQKDHWIYPYCLESLPESREKIDNGEPIFLVESIGDSMVLSEHGVENHLVTFGLQCSAPMQSFLLSKDPKEVIIVGNNDEGPNFDYNRGKVSAVKTLIKLSSIFPLEKLKIKSPTMNDLGEMHECGADVLKWSQNGKNLSAQEIKDFISDNQKHFSAEKTSKFLKKL